MDLKSLKPEELALEIQDFMGRKFIHPAHVVFILTEGMRDTDKLDKLMFTAKYVTGLKKVVSSGSFTEDKYINKIFTEFNENVQKMITLLDDIADESDEPGARELGRTFLKMDHESLAKSMELAEDLSLCKEFFNRNEQRFGIR